MRSEDDCENFLDEMKQAIYEVAKRNDADSIAVYSTLLAIMYMMMTTHALPPEIEDDIRKFLGDTGWELDEEDKEGWTIH